MSMLEELMAQAGGLDLAAIGAKVGLSPEQVQSAAGALLPKIADPAVDNDAATAEVAASHGFDISQLQSLVPALVAAASSGGQGGQGGVLGSLISGLGGAGGAGGIMGSLSGALDRDGDGNPVNDILGMFGKK